MAVSPESAAGNLYNLASCAHGRHRTTTRFQQSRSCNGTLFLETMGHNINTHSNSIAHLPPPPPPRFVASCSNAPQCPKYGDTYCSGRGTCSNLPSPVNPALSYCTACQTVSDTADGRYGGYACEKEVRAPR